MSTIKGSGRLLTQTKAEYEADDSRMRATQLKWMLAPQGPQNFHLCHQKERAVEETGEELTTVPKVDDRVMGGLFHESLLEGRVGWLTWRSEKSKSMTDPAFQTLLVEAGWELSQEPTGEYYKSTKKGYYNPGDPKTKTVLRGNPETCKPILSLAEEQTLADWTDGVMRNPDCRRLIEAPRIAEQVIHWDEEVAFCDPQTGEVQEIEVGCKCAIDIYLPQVLACLKTTRASSLRTYTSEMWTWGYALQAAFYMAGRQAIPDLEECPFQHLVMFKGGHNFAYLWTLSKPWMRIGANHYRNALERWAVCQYKEETLGLPPMEAWPDDLAAESGLLLPADWMLTTEGIKSEDYDPN